MTQDNTETIKIEAPKKAEEDLSFELIEVEDAVSIQDLIEWKKTDNYTLIEYHILKGNIEMLPKEDLAAMPTPPKSAESHPEPLA